MCGPYWSQWDKSDLDDWQGKLEDEDDCDVDLEDEDDPGDGRECSCSSGCMDCLGLSWRDFM